ncbi:MAG: hypothetical protein JNK48_01045 [Bryobacterales bacterium]|nr:hypothetical protein [Bryobacterales bacterium]
MFRMNGSSASSQARRKLVLLAPEGARIPEKFRNRKDDSRSRTHLLAELQRLRGRVYLEDGAIKPRDLTSDKRHIQTADEESWHILVADENNRVSGCARYLSHSAFARIEDLGVSSAPIVTSPLTRLWARAAIDAQLQDARDRGLGYVEVGGWALTEELRWSAAALHLALASYALAEILGGCLSIGTVTHRHASSSILRRIGGASLQYGGMEAGSYFDPRYGCDMEILTFDSGKPNPKYKGMLLEIQKELSMEAQVVGDSLVPAVITEPVLVPATASLAQLSAA